MILHRPKSVSLNFLLPSVANPPPAAWRNRYFPMANPLVIDGRNIYDKAELVAEGFTYKAIGK